MVGYIALAEFVPMFTLAFVGGALADYVDKRKLLQITEIFQTSATVGLLINSLLPQPRVWVLFVCVALHAGLGALQRPAFESLIQRVIPSELLPAVMALNSIRFHFALIIGPAVAGIIATQLSAWIVYAIDLATFVATLLAVFLLGYIPPPENPERPSLQGVKKGIRYAFSRQELLGTYFIDIAAMFFAFPQALYPALAIIYGPQYVGFFPAAIAIGALTASLTSGWAKNVHRHGVLVVASAILWGVGILFFGLVDSLVLALVFLAVAGFFDMISGIFRSTIWNQTIPNYLRGRLAGIEMISYLAGPMLGSAKMGLIAETTSVKFALVSGGALCIVAVVATALFLPNFFHYDGREGVKQREREEAERAELLRVSEAEF